MPNLVTKLAVGGSAVAIAGTLAYKLSQPSNQPDQPTGSMSLAVIIPDTQGNRLTIPQGGSGTVFINGQLEDARYQGTLTLKIVGAPPGMSITGDGTHFRPGDQVAVQISVDNTVLPSSYVLTVFAFDESTFENAKVPGDIIVQVTSP